MKKIIFYSWQSDLPNSTNRGFIEDALLSSVKLISKDPNIEIEPVIERDTKGVGGSPDISKTILDKIDSSSIFVADVSIINNNNKGRPTPNPNVLIELGYALKALGPERIILLINKSFGGPELLPFDLKMRRVLVYENNGKDAKSESKKDLIGSLKSQITLVLNEINKNSEKEIDLHAKTLEAIGSKSFGRIKIIRGYNKYLVKSFKDLYPGSAVNRNDYDDSLLDSINKTEEIISNFGEIIEEIAIFEDESSLREILTVFNDILICYDLSKDFKGGAYDKRDFDFYKFIGDELFVVLVSILIREQKWPLIEKALETRFILSDWNGNEKTFDFEYISENLLSLVMRKERLKSNRISIHADLLQDRHSKDPMSNISNFEDYMSGDLFLFLVSASKKFKEYNSFSSSWFPFSLLFIKKTPKFLLLAQSMEVANQIMKILGFQDVSELKEFLNKAYLSIQKLWNYEPWILSNFEKDINDVGSYT
ncbi:MAG: hypothetical protein WC705_00060 [Candidatus Paceibacterota bacterium]|jgi:hypothetical protein